jgi:hypothetical protein
MNNLMKEILINPITLVLGSNKAATKIQELIAYLAATGRTINIIDAGNMFDAYYVSKKIRQNGNNPSEVLKNIFLSRAFTCFQVVELVEAFQEKDQILIVLDILSTFYDENVSTEESERLLGIVTDGINRLGYSNQVIVYTRLNPACSIKRLALVEKLQNLAGSTTYHLPEELHEAKNIQPTLIEM